MRHTLYIIVFLSFISKITFSQDSYLERLSISGYIGDPDISATGEVWAPTSAGKVYYISATDQLCRENNISDKSDYSSNHFERINILSDSIIILSGFLQDHGKQDFILRSEDYGNSWTKVRFGESSWLDGACFNKDGKGWMTGSSQFIYYTEDNGKTWQTFDKIEKTGNLRLISVSFKKDGKTGLFGSTWNSLYLTTDNCKTWNKIPTPLTQNKYTRVSEGAHPDIRKVRFFTNHYIIRQEGRTFITKADKIDWQYHPEITDFEITENGHLYTLQKDGRVQLFGPEFSSVWASSQKVHRPVGAMTTQSEKLIILTHEQLYQISPDKFIATELLRGNSAIAKPDLTLQMDGEDYGFAHKDVLKYDATKKQWFRYMTLDFNITNADLIDEKLLISDDTFNNFYELNLLQKTFKPASLPDKIIDLKTNPVVEFHLEQGSQGCFHQNNAIQSFLRKGNQFIFSNEASHGSSLLELNEAIDAKTIDYMAGLMTSFQQEKLTIEDLKISKQDIANFKKYIDRQILKTKKKGMDEYNLYETLYSFPGENTDFSFYKQVADSLFSLPAETINSVFSQPDSYWSTTTNTRRVIFVLKDGQRLIAENSYNHPNYLLLPWDVRCGPLRLKSKAIQFSRAIDRLTNGSFFGPDIRDKHYAIFRIADYLYRQKMLR